TELLAARAGYSRAEAERHLYRHVGRRSVEHLFRVTSSLDSMVVGEAQIQGQVRAAYEEAQGVGGGRRVVGPMLSRLFEMALHTGGRVRSQTALGLGAASVPSVAVELAKKIFGSLRGRRAMVLGAGEMSQLMLECLDRKSTRLNSSHVKISYAVFCLKKKKSRRRMCRPRRRRGHGQKSG